MGTIMTKAYKIFLSIFWTTIIMYMLAAFIGSDFMIYKLPQETKSIISVCYISLLICEIIPILAGDD